MFRALGRWLGMKQRPCRDSQCLKVKRELESVRMDRDSWRANAEAWKAAAVKVPKSDIGHGVPRAWPVV